MKRLCVILLFVSAALGVCAQVGESRTDLAVGVTGGWVGKLWFTGVHLGELNRTITLIVE